MSREKEKINVHSIDRDTDLEALEKAKQLEHKLKRKLRCHRLNSKTIVFSPEKSTQAVEARFAEPPLSRREKHAPEDILVNEMSKCAE